MRFKFIGVIGLCALLLSSTPWQVQAQSDDQLLIFAASSLTNAFTALSANYEAQYDVQITLNFAGSSTLAAQIRQGAPADLFASANQQQMQQVIDDGLIDETEVITFAENQLIIITPANNSANIQSAQDLAGDDLLLTLAAPEVPIRDYTDELLQTLAIDYGADFIESVTSNLVSEETNVRQIVARVALDEVDAGIVYRTDVTPDVADMIHIIELPAGTSPLAEYSIAPLRTITSDQAHTFIEFVRSDEGQAILQSWGFCSPKPKDDEVIRMMTVTPTAVPSPEVTPDATFYC